MRGGNDAGGNTGEAGCVLAGSLADVPGTVAGHVTERATEGAQAAPARVEGNLADGHLRVPEQGAGPLDAAREQVAMRRQSEGFLELAREVRGRNMAHLRQARDGPFLVRRPVHAVLRPQQAAKECWILGVHPVCVCFSGSWSPK